MGSHASPDLWISAKKNPRSAELRRTFCDAEFRRKKKQQKSEGKPLNQQKSTTHFVMLSSAEP